MRLDPEVEKSLAELARRTRRSKSDIAREVITRHLRAQDEAYLMEARRLSVLARATDPSDLPDMLDEALADIVERFPE